MRVLTSGGPELLIVANPDVGSRLPFLLRVPLTGGDLVFRTSGTWPRTRALYCYPVPLDEWPPDPVLVERIAVRSCVRRGPAIDVIAARGRENRSQIVFTTARGRSAVFWQSARTRKQARPNVAIPTARAQGVADLEIVVDARERYGYRFAGQQVRTIKKALPCGDYGILNGDRLVAVVERKSLPDLVSSMIGSTLRYQIADLATVGRAAVVIEDRYSQLFKLDRVRPAVIADGLAELYIRYPMVPIVFCETRPLAEEFTYRFLAAAHTWTLAEPTVPDPVSSPIVAAAVPTPALTGGPATGQVRAWARSVGLAVPDRGRLRPEIWQAWRDAHPSSDQDIGRDEDTDL